MAHPEHTPTLDGHDRLTVRLYRSGFFLAPVALIGLAAGFDAPARWGLALASTLCAWNVHLYDKRFRWLIPGFAWVGALAGAAAGDLSGAPRWFATELSLGLHLVVFSALALKEQLCFRVPLLRLVPVALCVTALSHAFAPGWWTGLAAGLAAAVIGRLALAKSAQPLGFDIGDRAHYQI